MCKISKVFLIAQKIILYALFLQCLQMIAIAEGEVSSKPFRFSCVIWKKLSFPELYYRQGKEYIELELLPNNRSQTYLSKGMANLEIFVPDLDDAGRQIYRQVGESPLENSASRMLFFIVEGSTGSEWPIRVLGIDDSLSGFPVGHTRFVNMSKSSLKITFGHQKTDLTTKSISTLKSDISKNGGLLPFLVTDTAGNQIYQTRLMTQPRGRDMVFILPPNRPNGAIGVKFLPQIVPALTGTE